MRSVVNGSGAGGARGTLDVYLARAAKCRRHDQVNQRQRLDTQDEADPHWPLDCLTVDALPANGRDIAGRDETQQQRQAQRAAAGDCGPLGRHGEQRAAGQRENGGRDGRDECGDDGRRGAERGRQRRRRTALECRANQRGERAAAPASRWRQ